MLNDRQLPAYARALVDLRSRGMRPASQTVVIRLDRWPAKDRPTRVAGPQVVVPTDKAPATMDFGFLADLEAVVMFWRSLSSSDRLRDLLRSILAAKPKILLVLDAERDGRAWFVKSLSRGVENAL